MKVRFSLRMKNGDQVQNTEERDLDISQVIALYKSDEVSYPANIRGIIRPTRAEINESVFDINHGEPIIDIGLIEIMDK